MLTFGSTETWPPPGAQWRAEPRRSRTPPPPRRSRPRRDASRVRPRAELRGGLRGPQEHSNTCSVEGVSDPRNMHHLVPFCAVFAPQGHRARVGENLWKTPHLSGETCVVRSLETSAAVLTVIPACPRASGSSARGSPRPPRQRCCGTTCRSTRGRGDPGGETIPPGRDSLVKCVRFAVSVTRTTPRSTATAPTHGADPM